MNEIATNPTGCRTVPYGIANIPRLCITGIVKPENFVSLMYYFGMLTYGRLDNRGRAVLTIPNQCVREAIAQANRYAASEKVQTSLQGCELIKLYVVYRGMEMAALDCI